MAVRSDAWHHRSDAITSAFAFVGVSVALIGGKGWEAADRWAALGAACIILYNAWRQIQPAILELSDVAPDRVTEAIEQCGLRLLSKLGGIGIADIHAPVFHARKHERNGSGADWIDDGVNLRRRTEPGLTVASLAVQAVRIRAAKRDFVLRREDRAVGLLKSEVLLWSWTETAGLAHAGVAEGSIDVVQPAFSLHWRHMGIITKREGLRR